MFNVTYSFTVHVIVTMYSEITRNLWMRKAERSLDYRHVILDGQLY